MSEQPKPVAWAVIGDDYEYATLLEEHAVAEEEEGGKVVPLYRSPTLTDEEREAVNDAVYLCGATAGLANEQANANAWATCAATLRKLLERLA